MMLYIRNMQSSRCQSAVRNELVKLGLRFNTIELGKVELENSVSEEYLKMLDNALKSSGLEIIQKKEELLIQKIKDAIEQLVYFSDDLPKPNYSHYISNKVNYDYNYLSNLFSGTQGITIEKYIIEQKIKRVKELLIYDNLSLSDIAFMLHYSSVAHLSNQFKKVTGLTPTHFVQRRHSPRQKS
ncbi:MAG: AraC family transcriptional regulator [Bacteroidales bacterium]